MSLLSSIFNSGREIPESFFEMLPDATVVITSDGNILKSNLKARDLFGLSVREMNQSNISDLIQRAVIVIETAISTGKVQIGKATVENNRLVYLEVNAKMEVTETDKNSQIVVTMRDVTDDYIQNAEIFSELEDYRECGGNKNNFLINISNDLQSPLHSIVGFSQALLENLGGELSEKQRRYISIINKNSSELLSVFDKVITMSKLENSSIDIEYKNFDIIENFNTSLNVYGKKAADNSLTFAIKSENLITRNCYTDESLIKLLINNFFEIVINNASSDNITVDISTPTKETAESLKLNFKDENDEKNFVMFNFSINNFSIPKNEFELIMNPYEQAKKENKKYFETSLCFAIVKKITQFLSGTIFIKSISENGVNIGIIIKPSKVEQKENG